MSKRLICRMGGSVKLPDPEAYLQAFCATARSYAEIDQGAGWARIDLGYAAFELKHGEDELSLSIRANDDAALAVMRAMATAHLREARQDEALDYLWSGPAPRLQRAYREMEVLAAREITPRMRRFTLRGEDLRPFAQGGLHVSLFFPGDAKLAQPRVEETGRVIWPGEAPPVRAYTIRYIDVAAGIVEIDMLLHPSHGEAPGAEFARDAAPGDVIGMAGPGGAQMPPSRWVLLLGDETALPAIARLLEGLGPEVKALVRIEVTDELDELPLVSRADMDLRWLHRRAMPAAKSRLLLEALREVEIPGADGERFVWFAAEMEIARQAKIWLRQEAGLPPADFTAAGFWRAAD